MLKVATVGDFTRYQLDARKDLVKRIESCHKRTNPAEQIMAEADRIFFSGRGL